MKRMHGIAILVLALIFLAGPVSGYAAENMEEHIQALLQISRDARTAMDSRFSSTRITSFQPVSRVGATDVTVSQDTGAVTTGCGSKGACPTIIHIATPREMMDVSFSERTVRSQQAQDNMRIRVNERRADSIASYFPPAHKLEITSDGSKCPPNTKCVDIK